MSASDTPIPPGVPMKRQKRPKPDAIATPVGQASTPFQSAEAKTMHSRQSQPIRRTPPPPSPILPSERKRKINEEDSHVRKVVVTEPSPGRTARARKELREQFKEVLEDKQAATKTEHEQMLHQANMQHEQEKAALLKEAQAMRKELESERKKKDVLQNHVWTQFRLEFEKAMEENRQALTATQEASNARIAALERQIQDQNGELSTYRAAHSLTVPVASHTHATQITPSGFRHRSATPNSNSLQEMEIDESPSREVHATNQEGNLSTGEGPSTQPSKKQKLAKHQGHRTDQTRDAEENPSRQPPSKIQKLNNHVVLGHSRDYEQPPASRRQLSPPSDTVDSDAPAPKKADRHGKRKRPTAEELNRITTIAEETYLPATIPTARNLGVNADKLAPFLTRVKATNISPPKKFAKSKAIDMSSFRHRARLITSVQDDDTVHVAGNSPPHAAGSSSVQDPSGTGSSPSEEREPLPPDANVVDIVRWIGKNYPWCITRGRAKPLSRQARQVFQDNRRIREPNEKRTELLALIRDLHQKLLEITFDHEIVRVYVDQSKQGTLVSAEQVRSFCDEKEQASSVPGLKPMRIYWQCVRSPWNLTLASMFSMLFIKLHPEKKDLEAEIEDHFLERIKTLKGYLSKSLVLASDEADVVDVANALLLMKRKDSRMNERRMTLFRTRLDITHDISEATDGDKLAWKQIHWMLEFLGAQGMSSDESESDSTEHRRGSFLVRRREWRSDEILALLKYVDEHRKKYGMLGGALPGTPPRRRRRLRVGAPASTRKAIIGLPVNFYRPEWLEGLTASQRKLLNAQRPYPLPKLSDDMDEDA